MSIENDCEELVAGLDSAVIEKEVEIIHSRSQSDLLRNSTFEFLQKQMKDLDRYESVIQNALNSLNDRIIKNELDAKDTLSVINSLTAQVTNKTSVILEPFKAAPASSSPLMSPPKEDEDTSFEKGLKEMSPQQLQLLDKFIRTVASIKSE